jgi:hypothetical protein
MPEKGEVKQKKVEIRRLGKDIDEEMPSRYRFIHLNEDWHKSASGKRSNKSKPKRKHRRVHGKIGFYELSNVIAKRWHKLEEVDTETKTFVTKVASQLLEVYKREMAAFKEIKAQSMAGNNSTAALFPVIPISSAPLPKISYPPPPSCTFHNPAFHSPPRSRVTFDANTYAAASVSDDIQFHEEDQVVLQKKEQRKEGEDPLLSEFTFYPVSRQAYKKRKTKMEEDMHRDKRRCSSFSSSSSSSSSSYKKDGNLTMKDIESEKNRLKRKIRDICNQMKSYEAKFCDRGNDDDDCLETTSDNENQVRYDYDSVRSIIMEEIESFLSRHFKLDGRRHHIRASKRRRDDTLSPSESDYYYPAPIPITSLSEESENESKMSSEDAEDLVKVLLN